MVAPRRGWKLPTGAASEIFPSGTGRGRRIYERFRCWSADGTWNRLLAHAQQRSDAVGAVDSTVRCVDSTTVRPTSTRLEPERRLRPGEVIGRSRDGLTTKIQLACDGQGRPLAFTITAVDVNGCTQFEQIPARIRIERCGPGQLRTPPGWGVADKGYPSTKIRFCLRRRGIKASIPERIDQINGRIRREEGLCHLGRAAYRRRNVSLTVSSANRQAIAPFGVLSPGHLGEPAGTGLDRDDRDCSQRKRGNGHGRRAEPAVGGLPRLGTLRPSGFLTCQRQDIGRPLLGRCCGSANNAVSTGSRGARPAWQAVGTLAFPPVLHSDGAVWVRTERERRCAARGGSSYAVPPIRLGPRT